MSLNTMKRKTAAKLNLSGKGPKQTWMSQGPHGENVTHVISTGFSLNGGHRNIGRVGQTNLGRSVTRTPFRGNAPMGNGGSKGKYPIVISNSGSSCTNDSNSIKPSSLNTKGMLARRYKWMSGGGTKHHGDPAHNPVKPDDNYPLNHSQGSYIESKASTAAITSLVRDAGNKDCHAIGGKCGHHIGGKYYQRNMYYKNPSQPQDYSQYKLFLARKSLRNCTYCACADPNADPETCGKKLCPPGSCPTCKGHYDSTAGASIESPELAERLGMKCLLCPGFQYIGLGRRSYKENKFSTAVCNDGWTDVSFTGNKPYLHIANDGRSGSGWWIVYDFEEVGVGLIAFIFPSKADRDQYITSAGATTTATQIFSVKLNAPIPTPSEGTMNNGNHIFSYGNIFTVDTLTQALRRGGDLYDYIPL